MGRKKVVKPPKPEPFPCPTPDCENMVEQVWLKTHWSDFKTCKDCRMKIAREARKRTDTRYMPFVPHEGRDGKGGQDLIMKSKKQYILIVAGNGWGKDVGCMGRFCYSFADMLMEEYRDQQLLTPRVHAWVLAPTIGLTDQNWRYFLRFFPEDWIIKKDENERKIMTKWDGLIEFKSTTNPNSLVSVSLDMLLWTEIAQSEQQDKLEVAWANLFSRLHRPGRGPGGKGGIFLGNSTPNGLGLFHKMYLEAKENPKEWDIIRATSLDSPYTKKSDFEKAKRTLPDRLFKQFWLAEFPRDSGELFANLDTLCSLEPADPNPNQRYFGGWDPASPRGEDFSVLVIRDSGGNMVHISRWSGVPWDDQVNRVAALSKKFNHCPIVVETNAIGEHPYQLLTRTSTPVVPIKTTNEVKVDLVNHFAVLCEKKCIGLLRDDFLIDELRIFNARQTPGGKLTYSAPKHKHDDLVMATLFAYKDYNEPSQVLPYVGLLLGAKRRG